MKLKKLTALLSTAAMTCSLAPMAMAAEAPVYTFDAATNTFVVSDTHKATYVFVGFAKIFL